MKFLKGRVPQHKQALLDMLHEQYQSRKVTRDQVETTLMKLCSGELKPLIDEYDKIKKQHGACISEVMAIVKEKLPNHEKDFIDMLKRQYDSKMITKDELEKVVLDLCGGDKAIWCMVQAKTNTQAQARKAQEEELARQMQERERAMKLQEEALAIARQRATAQKMQEDALARQRAHARKIQEEALKAQLLAEPPKQNSRKRKRTAIDNEGPRTRTSEAIAALVGLSAED